MTKKIYLETLKSVLGRSVSHYSQKINKSNADKNKERRKKDMIHGDWMVIVLNDLSKNHNVKVNVFQDTPHISQYTTYFKIHHTFSGYTTYFRIHHIFQDTPHISRYTTYFRIHHIFSGYTTYFQDTPHIFRIHYIFQDTPHIFRIHHIFSGYTTYFQDTSHIFRIHHIFSGYTTYFWHLSNNCTAQTKRSTKRISGINGNF